MGFTYECHKCGAKVDPRGWYHATDGRITCDPCHNNIILERTEREFAQWEGKR